MSTPPTARPPDGMRRPEINRRVLVLAMVVTVVANIPCGAVAVTYALRGDDARAKRWIGAAVIAGLLTAAIILAVRAA